METEQQKRLKHAIAVVCEWEEPAPATELHVVFSDLMDLDQSKDIELWDELRRALAENPELKYPVHRRQVGSTAHPLRYWWWDPKNWSTDNE